MSNPSPSALAPLAKVHMRIPTMPAQYTKICSIEVSVHNMRAHSASVTEAFLCLGMGPKRVVECF